VLGILALTWWSLRLLLDREHPAGRIRVPAIFALGGVAHYAAYCQLGVPPYHWYYAPPLVVLSLFFVIGLSALRRPTVATTWKWTPAVVASAIVFQLVATYARGLRWDNAPITTNWATPAEYEKIGVELRGLTGNRPVIVRAEVGALSYFCDCTVVNEFSSPPDILKDIEAFKGWTGPFGRRLLRMNYRFLDESASYPPSQYELAYVSVRPDEGAYWPVTSPWKGSGFYLLKSVGTPLSSDARTR
jgi:hypothetical protein